MLNGYKTGLGIANALIWAKAFNSMYKNPYYTP